MPPQTGVTVHYVSTRVKYSYLKRVSHAIRKYAKYSASQKMTLTNKLRLPKVLFINNGYYQQIVDFGS